MEIMLASASPRRRELLALTGWHFSVCASPIPESAHPGEAPQELAKRLALAKAESARNSCPDTAMILAADTMVIHKGAILGKPADDVEAAAMLQGLRAGQHEVITAIAIQGEDGASTLELCESKVPMRDYQDEEIQTYVEGGSPLDKAGAYGIQDPDFTPVDPDAFHDCFANVMGLPLCHLVRAMQRLGHDTPEDVPARCMQFTGYQCTIYPEVLRGER